MTSIAKGHFSLYHRADDNRLLMRVTRRELAGLFADHIGLPRKVMPASVRTVLRLPASNVVWRGSVQIWHSVETKQSKEPSTGKRVEDSENLTLYIDRYRPIAAQLLGGNRYFITTTTTSHGHTLA